MKTNKKKTSGRTKPAQWMKRSEINKSAKAMKSAKTIAKTSAPLFPSLVPTSSTKKTHTPKPKSSPTDYYNCLLNYAQSGFYDSQEGKMKIHSCCKKCKQLAPTLNNQRDKELVKLITSYKQVGDSLAKLLRPIN